MFKRKNDLLFLLYTLYLSLNFLVLLSRMVPTSCHCPPTPTHTHACIHTHTHTRACAPTHAVHICIYTCTRVHTCTLTQTPQCLCTGLSPQIAAPISSYSSGSDPPRGTGRNYERRQWCGGPCESHYSRVPPPIPLSWLQKCSGGTCTLYTADASPPPPPPLPRLHPSPSELAGNLDDPAK